MIEIVESTLGMPPAVGAQAPDVTLLDDRGASVRFSNRWSNAPRGLILVFIRHFG